MASKNTNTIIASRMRTKLKEPEAVSKHNTEEASNG